MPKVSAEHKEQVRQRLIDATRRVVFRDGHDGATTRAILAEAGLSAGALYTYFSSKEELFEAVAEQVVSANVVLYAAEASPGEPPAERLREFVTSLLTEPDGSPALAWFRGRMSADTDVRDAIRQFNEYVLETFAPLVRAAQRNGELRGDLDPEALIELFDVVVEGMNKREVLGTFATDFERVGAVATQILLTAITQGAPAHDHG